MSNNSDTNGMNKNAIINFPDSKSVETQASEWLAILDAEEPSEEVIQGFKEWVNADDKHRQSFEGLIEFWGDLNILTQVVLPREEAPKQTVSDSFWSAHKLTVSSMILFITVVSALWITPDFQEQAPLVYVTKVGEQKTIELPDHTTVFLNTNSQIEVDYDDQKRRIRLLRGEAHFDVFHNPQKPFEVFAEKRLVRAIGTAFAVHIRKVDVEVIVTEGIVEIDNAEPITLNVQVSNQQDLSDGLGSDSVGLEQGLKQTSFESSVQVKAGNIARYDRQTLDQIRMVVAQQVEDELSWRQGMLIFKGEPLEKVVEEVSRYTSLRIIIPERQARELKIGGFFKIGDTESLFEALQEGFDIHVNRVSDNMVYLISNENR